MNEQVYNGKLNLEIRRVCFNEGDGGREVRTQFLQIEVAWIFGHIDHQAQAQLL